MVGAGGPRATGPAAGRTKTAIDRYEAALRIVEKTRLEIRTEYKFSIQARLLRLYAEYIDVLVARRQPEQALVIADLSRGRVLAERQGVAAPPDRLPRHSRLPRLA